MNKNITLYKKYFADTGFERLNLFELLRDNYSVGSAIYPGSFVHIAPSFVFPRTAYVDSDRRVQQFFDDPEIKKLVDKRKQYPEGAEIFAAQQGYEKKLPLEEQSFDLLISQYAGFVSQAGKKYLKIGGILVANNSHADAAMAFIDQDYELIAVANHTSDKWRISTKDLAEFFKPKKGEHPSMQDIQNLGKGIGYTKTASNYIFKRVS